MGNHWWTAQQINENELDLRNGNKEGKEKSKSKSLTNAEWHEYVRNLHYNKNKLNFSVKGGTQKSTTKKIKFDQNTNDSLYLCGGEFLWWGWYIKRRVSSFFFRFRLEKNYLHIFLINFLIGAPSYSI